jgi:polysaccharide pyruvyl transferase WcaK-like protein
MPLTVHHYYPYGSSNLGDLLVARALRLQIPRYFGDCRFVDLPVNDRYPGTDRPVGLTGENITRSNAEADLIVIGGSNLLQSRTSKKVEGKRLGRWGVQTDLGSIGAINKPILLVGMGTGSSWGKKIPRYAWPADAEIKALHDKAIASAVRDDATVRELARIGVSTRCTGCPVTFTTDAAIEAPAAGATVAVSFPPIRILKSLTGRRFMAAAMKHAAQLKAAGVPVVVTLHDSEDIEPAKTLVPKGLEVFYTENLEELVARFAGVGAVIGYRLHAALLGFGLGKPIIPVGVDWRGKAFIETFGLQPFSVQPTILGGVGPVAELTRKLIAADPTMIAAQRQAKARFQRLHDAFLAEAAAKFKKLQAR